MHRREFLKSTGTLMAGAALTQNALAEAKKHSPAAETTQPQAGGRQIIPINRNWRFSPTLVSGAEQRDFDDSSMQRVVIPHTNVRLPWHSFDEKSYEFVSTYRRRFRLPQPAQGRRVFVDFEGAMTASTVWINGNKLGEYKGGYTPFSFELTPHLDAGGDNVLTVHLDSSERPDIPPFGYQIDYLTFGGIYREVSLRIVPATYIENIFARPKGVLTGSPSLEVDCFLEHSSGSPRQPLSIEVELRDGERVVAKATQKVPATAAAPVTANGVEIEPAPHTVVLSNFGPVKLWNIYDPKLHYVTVRLQQGNVVIDEDSRTIGFREATFTDHGFELNGKVIKLRGLDRHQTFPFVGQAMPARVQARDAVVLRKNLSCNIVRTSHYPQSRHFLDECDRVGLLVLEEIPGWQHIGDKPWQDISVDNVRRMVRRDWNHPSIILWGVRINESRDNHDFYVRTNAMAHALDPTRQTGGIRYFQSSEFLEDVFTMNDFGFPLKPPNHPRYLNTEFVGHTYPTKTIDNVERLTEHALRHARIHDQLASNAQYAGGIGWCAFDYNTHSDFGSGDRICYHGVTDIFREPKPAAGFYKSQCDPAEQVVLEPAFHWARGDQSIGFTHAVVFSNCDQLKFYLLESGKEPQLMGEAEPDRTNFPHLPYPPFALEVGKKSEGWGDLRIDGYLKGKQVISKSMSGRGVDQKFLLLPDDTTLVADGADTTRVVLRVTDEFGAVKPFANDAIELTLEGPAEILGDNPFALVGGTGAVWIRTREEPGTVTLHARHPVLGAQRAVFTLSAAPPELA